MPRYYRIAQDTGLKEYDDSIPPYEDKCPKCGKLHSGNFPKCNNCIEEEEYWNYQHRKFFSHVEEEEDY